MVSRHASSPRHLTRRALLGSVLIGSASLAFAQTAAGADGPSGRSRPWLLSSSDELRPAKPAPPTPDELTELVALQGQRTAATLATIAPLG